MLSPTKVSFRRRISGLFSPTKKVEVVDEPPEPSQQQLLGVVECIRAMHPNANLTTPDLFKAARKVFDHIPGHLNMTNLEVKKSITRHLVRIDRRRMQRAPPAAC